MRKLSELFELALPHYKAQDLDQRFMCNAVVSAEQVGEISEEESSQLLNHIHENITRHAFTLRFHLVRGRGWPVAAARNPAIRLRFYLKHISDLKAQGL